MTTRPRLVRSVPYWILVVASIATLGFGAWLVVDKLGIMTATLTDASATPVDVYAGQSWIVFGAALAAAGLVGIFTALALAVLRGLLPAGPAAIVEPIDWTSEPETSTEPETSAEPTPLETDADDATPADEPVPASR